MRSSKLYISMLLLSATMVIACKNDKKQTTEAAAPVNSEKLDNANSFKVIAADSYLNWKANQIGGGHHGTFHLEGGSIEVKDNKLKSGSFVIDIKSLKVIDVTEPEDNKDITAHLLNPDFFDSDKFPKAYFTITAVEENNIKGNLKMKGIEKNISFPVKVDLKDNEVRLTSDTFLIDRTIWGITKSSGKFFDPVKLGDRLIKDEVEMSINITARK